MTVAIKPFVKQQLTRTLGRERFHFLSIVLMLVRRDLKVKYRGTVLGYAWSMLNPLLFMLIISLVFSHLVRGIEHYNIFVLSGILFWNMSSLTVTAGTGSIVGNASLIQKVKMPLWVFPMVPLGAALTNLILAIVPYIIVCIVSGAAFPTQIWLLPVVLLLNAVFLCGVTLGLSSLNVFFRDVAHVLEPVMALLFYATPVIYDRHSSAVPEKINRLLELNPFVHFIEAFRATVFQSGHPLTLTKLLVLVLLAATALLVGGFVYKNAKTRIALNL